MELEISKNRVWKRISGIRSVLPGILLLTIGMGRALAQDAPDGPPPPLRSNRPPMERAFRGHGGLDRESRGRWWDNPRVTKDLNLGTDQKQKMDDIFQQSRLKLIDLHASLQRQEATLEPLISADNPNEDQILAQIDKIASARAELEKSNARMLLSMRQVLTQEQWTRLKATRAERMAHGRDSTGDHGEGSENGRGDGPGME